MMKEASRRERRGSRLARRMVIGHYMRNMWQGGGIASYLRRLTTGQIAGGHRVIFLDLMQAVKEKDRKEGTIYCAGEGDVMAKARRAGVELLHAHCALACEMEGLPMLRSVHTHSPYCPSGGRYLKRQDRPCNRRYSAAGCAWGYLVDRCGSIRPGTMRKDFATTQGEIARLGAHHAAVPSAFVRDQMIRQGYDAARVHLLELPAPQPVDCVVALPDGPARFVLVGRLTPHKGAAWAIESMLQVLPEAQLDVAGDGNELDALRELAKRLGLGDRVTFHGWVEGTALDRLIDGARVVVFPSRWHEPFGLVSLEAMSRGRAVIASNVGALPEVVEDEVTGLIVDVLDRPSLAAAMNRLAHDGALAARLGRAGHERLRMRYRLEDHLKRLDALYVRCATEDARGGGVKK